MSHWALWGEENRVDITLEKLLEMTSNRYVLTVVISERTKELMAGARPLVKTKSGNAWEIAMQEILEGKLKFSEENEE